MNPWLDEARSLRFGGVATWTLATLAVIGAHGAGAAYLLRPVPQAQDAAAAPALMLELAPMPEAVNTDQTNIADNLQDAAEVKAPEPDPWLISVTGSLPMRVRPRVKPWVTPVGPGSFRSD